VLDFERAEREAYEEECRALEIAQRRARDAREQEEKNALVAAAAAASRGAAGGATTVGEGGEGGENLMISATSRYGIDMYGGTSSFAHVALDDDDADVERSVAAMFDNVISRDEDDDDDGECHDYNDDDDDDDE